jgi:hypothetical protein
MQRMRNGFTHDEIRKNIRNECKASECLMAIGERLLQREEINKYRWDNMVGFVLDAAEPFDRSAWELCPREEKLVLIQPAQ